MTTATYPDELLDRLRDPVDGQAALDLPGLTPVAAVEQGEPESAGRRQTSRQRALIDQGVHPLTKTRTQPELGTCGDCAFRRPGRWPKCHVDGPDGPYVTRGSATDVRAWWPACGAFTPKPPRA